MKKPGFVPFQKKSAGADPDGIPGNFDDSLPPTKGKSKLPSPAKGKGKKRPVKFGRPAPPKPGMNDDDGDEMF